MLVPTAGGMVNSHVTVILVTVFYSTLFYHLLQVRYRMEGYLKDELV